jgi:hypothetical protein
MQQGRLISINQLFNSNPGLGYSPGTVTELRSVKGMLPFSPRCRAYSRLSFFGALPEPLSAVIFLVVASKNKQNASLLMISLSPEAREVMSYPPIPQLQGSVTFKAADVATAASASETNALNKYGQ